MNNNNSNNCDNTREEMLERIKCLNFAIIESPFRVPIARLAAAQAAVEG